MANKIHGHEISVFSIRYWVADPNNGYPSIRKMMGYACLFVFLELAAAVLFQEMKLGELVPLLVMVGTGTGIYAVASPSKDKKPEQKVDL